MGIEGWEVEAERPLSFSAPEEYRLHRPTPPIPTPLISPPSTPPPDGGIDYILFLLIFLLAVIVILILIYVSFFKLLQTYCIDL